MKKNPESSLNVEEDGNFVGFQMGESWEKCFLAGGGTGCTYLHANSNGNIRPLVWDENKKGWMLPLPRTPGAEGTQVPPDVAGWLKHRLHETLSSPYPTLGYFMKYFLKKPWTPTPPHVNPLRLQPFRGDQKMGESRRPLRRALPPRAARSSTTCSMR